MKRKDYMKPTTDVVEVRIESHLLSASTSGRVDATMEYEWEEEDI